MPPPDMERDIDQNIEQDLEPDTDPDLEPATAQTRDGELGLEIGYRARPQFRAFHQRSERFACIAGKMDASPAGAGLAYAVTPSDADPYASGPSGGYQQSPANGSRVVESEV